MRTLGVVCEVAAAHDLAAVGYREGPAVAAKASEVEQLVSARFTVAGRTRAHWAGVEA